MEIYIIILLTFNTLVMLGTLLFLTKSIYADHRNMEQRQVDDFVRNNPDKREIDKANEELEYLAMDKSSNQDKYGIDIDPETTNEFRKKWQPVHSNCNECTHQSK